MTPSVAGIGVGNGSAGVCASTARTGSKESGTRRSTCFMTSKLPRLHDLRDMVALEHVDLRSLPGPFAAPADPDYPPTVVKQLRRRLRACAREASPPKRTPRVKAGSLRTRHSV